jgi:hypothetical protein
MRGLSPKIILGRSPCLRCWRGPHAWPTWHGRCIARGPARPARATRGARWRSTRWWRCTVSQWWHSTGARETAEETGGSTARGRRCSTTATGKRRGGQGGTATVRVTRLRTAAVGTVARSGRRREGRDGERAARGSRARGGQAAGARGETALSGRRRAVPAALLTCGSCTARGIHAATARCHAAPARRATSDRWDPLVSVFRIKIHSK